MKAINIRVIPNAKENKVIPADNGLKVRVTAPALEGKANKAVIEVLAKHLGVRKSDIRITRGEKSREKTIEIAND